MTDPGPPSIGPDEPRGPAGNPYLRIYTHIYMPFQRSPLRKPGTFLDLRLWEAMLEQQARQLASDEAVAQRKERPPPKRAQTQKELPKGPYRSFKSEMEP